MSLNRSKVDFKSDIPEIEGECLLDEASREAYGADFGGMVRHKPKFIAVPSNAQDIVSIIKFAKQKGLKVAARGKGHSTEGQSQTDGGIVISTSNLQLPNLIRLDSERHTVTLGAGSRWKDAVEVLAGQGFGFPVLPDYLGMSVGGTLSGAGIGKGSHRCGMQIDALIEMLVVTGSGETLRCSRRDNADLFWAVSGGLGQIGIIIEAVLEVEPIPPHVLQAGAFYANHSLRHLAADIERAARAPGIFSVAAINVAAMQPDGKQVTGLDGAPLRRWVLLKSWGKNEPCDMDSAMAFAIASFAGYNNLPGRISVATRSPSVEGGSATGTVPYLSFVNQMENAAGFRKRLSPDINGGIHPVDMEGKLTAQPWLDVFLPATKLAEFLGQVDFPILGPLDTALVFPIKAGSRETSSSLLQYPEGVKSGDIFFGFAILDSVFGIASTNRNLERNNCLLDLALNLGGRNYVIDNILNANHWHRHLGNGALDGFSRVKRKYDPERVFTGSVPIPYL